MSEQRTTTYPDFVKSEQGIHIFKLLSNFGDQYNKSTYWRKNQQYLYERRFKRFPANFLKLAFLDYLTYELPQFLPPITEVYKYCTARDDFDSRWLRMELGSRYCIHCRTSDDGLDGGVRNVFYYGIIPSLGKVGERSFAAKCNCEAGLRRAAIVYTQLVDDLKRIGGQDSEVTYSYYDEDRARIITAKEQSGFIWKRRLENGHYVENEDGQIVPNFSHPIYRTALGRSMAELYGFELPSELEIEIKLSRDEKKAREFEKRRKLKIEAGKSDVYIPKSISTVVTGVTDNWKH
jgi:hypothetical protein